MTDPESLFPDLTPTDPPAPLSAGRRRTARQHAAIAADATP